MKIISNNESLFGSITQQSGKVNNKLEGNVKSFDDTLKEFISDVNNLQNQAGDAMNKMATGESTDIHEVMIAVEKAKTSFDLLLQLKNQTVAAYQELIRMQV